MNNGILEQTQEQSLTEFTKWTKSIRVNAQYKVFTRMCGCNNDLNDTLKIIVLLLRTTFSRKTSGFIMLFMNQGT